MTAVRPSAGSSNTHRVSLCCQDEANQREELDCWTSSVISVISHRLHLPLVVFFKLVSMLMALCTPLCLTGSCTLHPSTITDGYEETSTHSQFSSDRCWWNSLCSSWFMAVDRAVAHFHHWGQTDSISLFSCH